MSSERDKASRVWFNVLTLALAVILTGSLIGLLAWFTKPEPFYFHEDGDLSHPTPLESATEIP